MTPRINSWIVSVIFVSSSRTKENHSKSFAPLFFTWLLTYPNILNFLSNCSHQKANNLKFIFCGQISLASAVKHSLTDTSLTNGFACLANKWATWKLTLVEASFFTFVGKYFVMRYFVLNFLIFQTVVFLWIGNIVMNAYLVW